MNLYNDAPRENRANAYVCTVPAATLRGLLQTAGDNDCREHLNGIHFEPQAKTLAAGNGDVLLIAKQEFNAICKPFIIPRKACEEVVELTTEDFGQIVVTVHECGLDGLRTFKLSGPIGAVMPKEINDRKVGFHDLLRCYPGAASHLGSLTEFEKLRTGMRTITGRTDLELKLQINDPFPALVACEDDTVIGVITPWTADRGLSAWCEGIARRLGRLDAADSSEAGDTSPPKADHDKP